MTGIIILLLNFLLLSCAKSTSTFDQRQTGDLNVQVDLKDLRIIALMKGGKEDYVDYDYAYDYSEMTIKPQNGTTPRPLNVTSTAADIDTDNVMVTTVITEQTTLGVKNNSQDFTNQVTIPMELNDSTTTIKNVELANTTEIELSIKNLTTTTSPQSSTNCKKGFIINQKGDCELKLQSAGNALLKLVKLSQKLKLRRENRKNEDESNVTKL